MTELFLEILNMSISASWLVLAVLALRFALKRSPKWVNVLLWGLVAFRLLCPFTPESALSLIPSAEVVSPEIMMDPTPEIRTGVDSINSVVNPVITESFAPDPAASANPLQIWIPVIAAVWCLGMAAMLLYTLASYLRLRHRVRTSIRVKGNIYLSEFVVSPFVLGLRRPRIYLPYHMKEQDRQHVIAHERAHIRRRDHWWKPLGFLLLSIHWFNPLMWLAYILLCRDIELACDEKVIRELGTDQRADYSQALLHCSVTHRSIAACPLAFGEVGVKERVQNVLRYKKPAFWVIVLCLILILVVSVCFLTDPKSNDKNDCPITMTLEYVSRSRAHLTFNYSEDLAADEFQISEAYTLEQLVDGNWEELSRLSEKQDLPIVAEANNDDFDAWTLPDWSEDYGRLSDGTYRIKKEITFPTGSGGTESLPCYTEFTIGGTAEDYITLKLENITPTGATLYQQETVDAPMALICEGSEGYWLEHWQDGQWTYMEPTGYVEPILTGEKRYVYALHYSSDHMELDWSHLYGELPPGTYRIAREITCIGGASPRVLTACAEFTVDSNWGIGLFIDRISENGITLSFLLDDSLQAGEYFCAGSTLQFRERIGSWTDVIAMSELSEGPDIVTEAPSFSLLWGEDMYRLTEGEHRVGIRIRRLLPDGTADYTTVYEYFDPATYAWGVTMEITEVSPESIDYVIQNTKSLPEGTVTLQNVFTIQQRANNQWNDLDAQFGDPEHPDSPITSTEGPGHIGWEGQLGDLPNGTYRLVRYVTRHHSSGETETRPIYAVFAVDSNVDPARSTDPERESDRLQQVLALSDTPKETIDN